MSVPFIPTKNATAGVTTAPTTSNLTTAGQMAINAYTGTMYMRKEDATISDIVGDRLSGFRNRIINGDMRIDQRNAGASVTVPTLVSTFSCDRFQINKDTSGVVLTAVQSSIAPTGFIFSQNLTVGTGASVGASEILGVQQKIEGLNVSDLGFGSASASAVTLSFWVRSSLTGTYAVALKNSANNRSYVQTYTITAANTWEQKSITILGDTTGTWLTTSGIGLRVAFDLGSGSSYSTTAGSWQSGDFFRTSGTVNWGATTGNTFYITGVQLEKGLVPTPFEVRSYGTELALCQRYWWRYSGNTIVGQTQAVGGLVASSTSATFPVSFQEMRATPSVSVNSTITDANYVNVQATTGKWTLQLDGVNYASKTSGTFTVVAISTSLSSAHINIFGGALSINVGTLSCVPTSGYLITANAEL